ncbi:hypothetical protein CSC02_4678 [Enterobacter hormaechei subsp. hoffmannii]|nr:hypothetical protein CSC02_4678 [Enterobacter hormaechei subsp. hoffmannii]
MRFILRFLKLAILCSVFIFSVTYACSKIDDFLIHPLFKR